MAKVNKSLPVKQLIKDSVIDKLDECYVIYEQINIKYDEIEYKSRLTYFCEILQPRLVQ